VRKRSPLFTWKRKYEPLLTCQCTIVSGAWSSVLLDSTDDSNTVWVPRIMAFWYYGGCSSPHFSLSSSPQCVNAIRCICKCSHPLILRRKALIHRLEYSFWRPDPLHKRTWIQKDLVISMWHVNIAKVVCRDRSMPCRSNKSACRVRSQYCNWHRFDLVPGPDALEEDHAAFIHVSFCLVCSYMWKHW
jgi:hypothetical protein